MKTKLVTIMLAGLLVITGVMNSTCTASAANVKDTEYSFSNTVKIGSSEWRTKTDTTKVYVYPKSGPTLRYTVYGRNDTDNSTIMPRSNQVTIPLGVKGSITNMVAENGNTMARINFERTSYAQAYTTGVWSPDSTKNYTIYN